MTALRALGLLAAAILLASSFVVPARAALVHNLSTVFGEGQITVATESGNSVAGVEEFEFNVFPGFTGGPQTYLKEDIATVTWGIDDDWVLTLNLDSFVIPFGPSSSGIFLSNDGTEHDLFAPCDESGLGNTALSISCVVGDVASRGLLTTEAVHIPEPATLTLFAGGLAGLLGWAWRRRRSS